MPGCRRARRARNNNEEGNQQRRILTDCLEGHSAVSWHCIYIHECM
ncbi:hypothetical protein X976_5756 [Burkholderia pseudomallei MSHR7500]|nr:hypothetical protein X976_5756 [Burkholderia pseudomallei MSHR7500]